VGHDPGGTALWTYDYDPNQNLVSELKPEGNSNTYTYEARDLLGSITRGTGSAEASTTSYHYDGNRNRYEEIDGRTHLISYSFDGFDRLKVTTNQVGSKRTNTFDESGNITAVLEEGTYGGPAPAPFMQLVRTEVAYDERSRAWRIDRSDPGTPAGPLTDGILWPGDGKVTNRQDFDRLGRGTYVIQDDKQIYTTRYDGAGRVINSIDPIGNESQRCYDDNDNLVRLRDIDKYPNLTTRSFDTYDIYDSLNRRISSTDNLGQTRRYSYDSRDNNVAMSDAQGPMTSQMINGKLVNGPGNSKSYQHDGFSRLVVETQDLRVGGSGSGVIDTSNPYNADGHVSLTQGWDLNSRLLFRTDDRSSTTSYSYDALDRQTQETYADTKHTAYTFDGNDNLRTVIDPRNDNITLTYDDANRLTQVDCVRGTYVVGSTQIQYRYDGLGRRTRTEDNVDPGVSPPWIVTRTFDALSRIVSETQNAETQNPRTVINTWTEEDKRSSLTYPSAITISNDFDALDRVWRIRQGTPAIVTYSFAGPGLRVLSRTSANGTVERHQDANGSDLEYYDGVRRRTKLEHVGPDSQIQTAFAHGFDRVGNRLYERRIHDSNKGDNYVYDSLYRIVSFERRVRAAAVGSPGGNGPMQVRNDWRIDGGQNWAQLLTNGVPATISPNSVNEYTSFGLEAPQYDSEGNMSSPNAIAAPSVTMSYDFLNRLRRIQQGSSVVNHDYDGEGRRARTTITGISGAPPQVEYVYDRWQVIEERNAANVVVMRRHVQGVYVDEPVRLENLAYYSGTGTYFYEESTLGHIAALTNAAGSVVERYTIDAYGAPQFETPGNAVKPVIQSDFGNPYLLAGSRYEPYIVGLYDMRNRMYYPTHGRFVQRDPIGLWGDKVGVGNPYVYAGGNPSNRMDPLGLSAAVLYPTPESAACGAIPHAYDVAGQSKSEFGGFIVAVEGGGYTFTTPTKIGAVKGPRPDAPPGTVAGYHTHGKDGLPEDEEFTPGDRKNAGDALGPDGLKGRVEYMGTPKGDIKKYDPRRRSDPDGGETTIGRWRRAKRK
jgi:RHS repeat-associated protein